MPITPTTIKFIIIALTDTEDHLPNIQSQGIGELPQENGKSDNSEVRFNLPVNGVFPKKKASKQNHFQTDCSLPSNGGRNCLIYAIIITHWIPGWGWGRGGGNLFTWIVLREPSSGCFRCIRMEMRSAGILQVFKRFCHPAHNKPGLDLLAGARGVLHRGGLGPRAVPKWERGLPQQSAQYSPLQWVL